MSWSQINCLNRNGFNQLSIPVVLNLFAGRGQIQAYDFVRGPH